MRGSQCAGVLLIATVAFAATPQRKPSDWSLEERIALRTNAKAAEERRSEKKRDRTTADAFDGRTHPELFLPHEVFDELINLGFSENARMRQVVRESLLAEAKRRGLGTDFWERLEAAATIHIADKRQLHDLGSGYARKNEREKARIDEAMALKQRDRCRSAAQAFAAARATFGREKFEQFLYELVAVNMYYAADRLPDPETLRNAERGCP
ncbi:MAG TPA: hypothetical protein VHW00_14065 [Thermoanaerobaculia bacterium]|nr:hypothetical protein [Thermoanaerobaculia bacterium]